MFSLKCQKPHLTNNTRWTTMVELMAVLAIMGMGIAAMLSTIGSGIDYAHDTEDNIKAINLAREGIEWVINVRDTNWLRFSSDVKNCWRVIDYKGTCIGGGSTPPNISSGSYLLYAQNGLWFLSGVTAPNYSSNWSGYKSIFQSSIDSQWYFTQTGTYAANNLCNNVTGTGCVTPFTREIKVIEVNTGTLQISSIVRWIEKRPREVIITTSMTNWKSNF